MLLPANRQVLSREFLVVWIHVPLEELLQRLSREREGRPLLSDANYAEKVKNLLEARLPLYQEASALIYRWKAGESTTDSVRSIMDDLVQAR